MSLTNENTNGMVMPVTPLYGSGNGNDGGFGNGDSWAWLILILLLAGVGGWGNNGGGFGGGAMPYILNNGYTADVQRGFDQSAVMTGINNLSTQLCDCCHDMAMQTCNQTTTLLQGQNGIGNSILNGKFDTVQAITNTGYALNNTMMANEMARQQCCCDNKLAIADLKSTVLTENCADREALSNGVRDILTNQNANTQRILDQMCNDKIDAKNEKIAELQNQLSMADLRASQIAQTAQIQRGQTAEVDALYERLKSCPVPSMPVAGMSPLFQCNPSFANQGCGCGCGA